ncbi:MAG: hydrolase [Acidobacteria bacterium]|nr:hydrolase [Acidobacteriota bacterium]
MAISNGLIHANSTVLVVVDLQAKLTPAISGIDSILGNTKKLLHLAKILPLKTLLTTQYRKGLGDTVSEITDLLDIEPIDKVCFGCLGDDVFNQQLAAALPNGGAVLLCGIEAHICVNQTALGALAKGYGVHVAADAVGSRSPENARIGLQRMRDAGAVISSTEMAIYELLGDSRRPEFKEMLPYLK